MSDTPETLDDEREYPQPEHAERITFEGRECVVLSPEGYEELFRKCQRFERERDALKAELAAAREEVATVAEVHMSRYTIEWKNGPLPEGTKLYAARKP